MIPRDHEFKLGQMFLCHNPGKFGKYNRVERIGRSRETGKIISVTFRTGNGAVPSLGGMYEDPIFGNPNFDYIGGLCPKCDHHPLPMAKWGNISRTMGLAEWKPDDYLCDPCRTGQEPAPGEYGWEEWDNHYTHAGDIQERWKGR